MNSGRVGIVLCVGAFIISAASVGLPYWLYISSAVGRRTYTGLWQTCSNVFSMGLEVCTFSSFGSIGWWDAIRALEIVGVTLALLGTFVGFFAACVKKKRGMFIWAALLTLLAAGCMAAGFITFAVKYANAMEYAHAGFYMNVIGCIGLCVGGLLLFCSRNNRGPQPGQILRTHAQPQTAESSGDIIAMENKSQAT